MVMLRKCDLSLANFMTHMAVFTVSLAEQSAYFFTMGLMFNFWDTDMSLVLVDSIVFVIWSAHVKK